MNKVVIIGNLTKDPEVRYTTGETPLAVCRFTLAVNDKKKNPQTKEWEDTPSFIPVTVFGKQGDNCRKFLSRGSKAAVEGRIQTGSYTNKEGQKVFTTEVVASNVEFLSSRSEKPAEEPSGFTRLSEDEVEW